MPDPRKLNGLAVFVERTHVARFFWQGQHQAECDSIMIEASIGGVHAAEQSKSKGDSQGSSLDSSAV